MIIFVEYIDFIEIMLPIQTYVNPEIQVVEILPEGVCCASNEPVYEENGEW